MVWYPGSGVPTASSQPFVKVLRSSDQTCRLFRAARSLPLLLAAIMHTWP